MSQIGESAMAGVISDDKFSYKCSHTEDTSEWKCNLEGETSGHLVDNISRDMYGDEPTWPPPNGQATFACCVKGNPGVWPHQAHHLIPWQQLKKHRAAHLLAKKKNHLTDDANYSVNHGNNGFFMPYASDLNEWTSLQRKQVLAEKLMNLVGIQLHQSRHSMMAYICADDGYKARVEKYLNIIHKESLRHYDVCSECKKHMSGNKWPPRKAVVRFVDKASRLLKSDIKYNRIFVSKRAAIWACKNTP